MQTPFQPALLPVGVALAGPALAQVAFYENREYGDRSFDTRGAVADVDRYGFDDRASSVRAERNRRQVRKDAAFRGRCRVLRPARNVRGPVRGWPLRLPAGAEPGSPASTLQEDLNPSCGDYCLMPAPAGITATEGPPRMTHAQ